MAIVLHMHMMTSLTSTLVALTKTTEKCTLLRSAIESTRMPLLFLIPLPPSHGSARLFLVITTYNRTSIPLCFWKLVSVSRVTNSWIGYQSFLWLVLGAYYLHIFIKVTFTSTLANDNLLSPAKFTPELLHALHCHITVLSLLLKFRRY